MSNIHGFYKAVFDELHSNVWVFWSYNRGMIYSLCGKVAQKQNDFFVIEAGGVGFKVFAPKRIISELPAIHNEVKIFCRVYLREDEVDIYGFLTAKELEIFELLNSVNGVGPRSALAVMDIVEVPGLLAAIKEGRPDVLARASGIGRKTAERIVLELREKVKIEKSEEAVRKMESDSDIVETLVGLGYSREQAREALLRVGDDIHNLEGRLKQALKILGRKQ